MFDPGEFLRLADLIGVADAAPHPQARFRSAVSRAYYAAFLTAREVLRPHLGNSVVDKKRGVHDVVIKALSWGDPGSGLRGPGAVLRQLKKDREQHDYDLPLTSNSTLAKAAAADAEKIIRDLASLDASKCYKGPF